MASDPRTVRIEGIVEEALPGLLFRISITSIEGASSSSSESKEILAHLGGRLKLNRIRIIPGDRVIAEAMPYDLTRGRIVRRL